MRILSKRSWGDVALMQCDAMRLRDSPILCRYGLHADRALEFSSARIASGSGLFRLDSRVADHRGPALQLGSHDPFEVLRAAADRVGTLREEFLLHFGQMHHTGHLFL